MPQDDDQAGGRADQLADETLVGVFADMLSDQSAEFYDAVARGEIDFDPGQHGAGIPPILSPLHGRRRDRNLYLAGHAEQGAPSLYGAEPENAAMSAVRSVLWVALHAPEHPIRLTPSRTGMLNATYALPGRVTVTNLLLLDRYTAADDVVVTAESLVAAVRAAQISPGTPDLPEGLALAESLLVTTGGDAPGPVPLPERAATHRVLNVPLEVTDAAHRLLPLPPGKPDEPLPVPAVTRGGQSRPIPVLVSTLAAIGWLDPFAANVETDPGEDLFVGVGARELYWWGNKTALLTPRSTG